jgi:hypothetical protein
MPRLLTNKQAFQESLQWVHVISRYFLKKAASCFADQPGTLFFSSSLRPFKGPFLVFPQRGFGKPFHSVRVKVHELTTAA